MARIEHFRTSASSSFMPHVGPLPCMTLSLWQMAEDTELTPLDYSFLDSVPHTYRLLASGGVAGCIAKTVTAPLSRLTILFQVCTWLQSNMSGITGYVRTYDDKSALPISPIRRTSVHILPAGVYRGPWWPICSV
jgi:hypothetical protein